MTRKHSPEPWCTDQMSHDEPLMDITIIAANDDRVAKVWIDDAPVEDFNAAQRLSARRIVACVNACAGWTTEQLEAMELGSMKETISRLAGSGSDAATWEARATKEASRVAELQAQVDELLAALSKAKESLEWCYDVTDYPGNGTSDQDKAIAMVASVIDKITGEPK